MLKRTLALILALVLCIGILAGCEQKPAQTSTPAETTEPNKPAETTVPTETTPTEPEKLYFEDGLVIEMYSPSDQGEYFHNMLKEMLNLDLNCHTMDNFEEQYGLLVSDNKIPALTYVNGDFFGNQYGPDGAYINVLDYLDQMPNLKAALEANPAYVERWIQPNGEMYHIPCINLNGDRIIYGYFYREDLFEKHNLTWPTTREELETVLRELKKLYPESYPMAIRNMGGAHASALVDWGIAFGAKLQFPGRNGAYATLNNETGKWYEGATAPEMKEMVTWLRDMMKEGLVHPSGCTMSAAEWNAYLNSGTSFISFDRVDRVPIINGEGVKTDENFTMVGAAPIKMSDASVEAYNAPSISPYSYLVAANAENLDDVLAYVDWLYSEAGVLATNYGIEGDTYTLAEDGTPVWTDACKAESQPQTDRGLAAKGGAYGIFDFNSFMAWQGDAVQRTYEVVCANATVTDYYVAVTYNEEEQKIADTYGEAYNTFTKGELIKFMLGERDIAEWDAFAQEASTTYHGAELVAIAQSAWDRANAG